MDTQATEAFEDIKSRLKLEDDVSAAASANLEKILALSVPPDTTRQGPWVWVVCAVFIAALEKRSTRKRANKTQGVKLHELLQVSGIKLIEFIHHLELLTQKLKDLPQAVADAHANLDNDYKNTSNFFAKYKKFWHTRARFHHEGPSLSDDDPIAAGVFTLGWYLYICCKGNVQQLDHVTQWHMMLACLQFIVEQSKSAGSSHTHTDTPTPTLTHAHTHTPVKEAVDEADASGKKSKGKSAKRGRKRAHDDDSLPPTSLGKALVDDVPVPKSGDAATMESMEEDAIAALSMMSASSAKPAKGIVTSTTSDLKKDTNHPLAILEQQTRVLAYVSDLLTGGVLSAVGESVTKVEPRTDLSGLFHPSVLPQNLANLREEYESRALTDVDSLDERFVLSLVTDEKTGQVVLTSAHTPPRRGARTTIPFTPGASGRILFQDMAELNRAGNQPLPPFSPMPSQSTVATPQKPQRPPMGTGLSTPIRSPRGMPFSHYQSPVAQTPVLAATEACNWLKTLEQLTATPSQKLIDYATAASGPGESVLAILQDRATELLERITFSSEASDDKGRRSMFVPGREDAMERVRRLGLAQYYKVLATVLDKETERLGRRNHRGLLTRENFHRALLACCVEVVLKAMSLVTLAFPKILDLFELQAWDLYRNVETFVRASSLPYLLRQHLKDLEDQMIEKVMWSKVQPGVPPGEEPRLFQVINEAKSTGHWPLLSMLDRVQGQPPTKPRSTMGPQPFAPLEVFFRKLLNLAAARITTLCLRLETVGRDNMDKIWTTFKYTVTEHVDMLKGRHMDMMVLCAIYAVCKVQKMQDITFKKIFEVYKETGRNSVPIIRDIELPSGQKGDIVKFYNEAYLPVHKSYVVPVSSQQQNNPQDHSQGPVISRLPQQSPLRSPQRLSSSNVFLSTHASPARHPVTGLPMREHHMTPRTRVLFAFGESPRTDLDTINKAVNKRPRTSMSPPIGGGMGGGVGVVGGGNHTHTHGHTHAHAHMGNTHEYVHVGGEGHAHTPTHAHGHPPPSYMGPFGVRSQKKLKMV